MSDDRDYLVVFEDVGGEFCWRRVAPNHETISRGESHPTERGAIVAALRSNQDLTEDDIRRED